MKALDIALKDMKRSFRSAFALIFMFGVPLLLAGMFYFMFGGTATNKPFNLPVTKVVIANQDQGGEAFNAIKAQLPMGTKAHSLGDLIVSTLEDQSFASLMQVSQAGSAEAARSAVDSQEAGIALIIPPDFSSQFSSLTGQATLELYWDPTLTIGPGIVQSVMEQFTDSFSGAKIAVAVTVKQTGSSDPALIGTVLQQYLSSSPQGDPSATYLDIQDIQPGSQSSDLLQKIIGPILGAMTIFYAFFTGTTTAQSILREDEEGTLSRLFTTPTTQSTILGGKFLSVGLTVMVQMVVLLLLGRLIFHILWGALLPVSLVTIGSILAAATFGIFVNSLLKDTSQSGLIFGGVLTVTGMLGMMPIFSGAASTTGVLATISLVAPQGWSVRGLIQVMNGAPLEAIFLTLAVQIAMSIVFFVIGLLRFQRRYA